MAKSPVEQLAWLQADRLTLLLFAVVWVGMIVASLLLDRTPWFLLAMLALLALVRYVAFHYFHRRITSLRRGPQA